MSFSFLFSPFFFVILATFGVSAWSLLSRKLLRNEKDFIAAGALNELFALFFLALILLFAGTSFDGPASASLAPAAPFNPTSVPPVGWLAVVISFFSYAGAVMLSYKAFQTGEANERAVINQTQNIWILLMAALLLSEPLLPQKVLGVLLISAAAVVCTYRPNHSRWHVEGVKLFFLTAILFGTGSLADKVAVQYFPLPLYLPVSFLGSATIALIFLGREALWRMRAVWSRHSFQFILFAALSVFPYLAFLLAVRELPVSIVGPLMNTNVVLTSLGGMLLLNEKEGWPYKLAGAALAFAGACVIGA